MRRDFAGEGPEPVGIYSGRHIEEGAAPPLEWLGDCASLGMHRGEGEPFVVIGARGRHGRVQKRSVRTTKTSAIVTKPMRSRMRSSTVSITASACEASTMQKIATMLAVLLS